MLPPFPPPPEKRQAKTYLEGTRPDGSMALKFLFDGPASVVPSFRRKRKSLEAEGNRNSSWGKEFRRSHVPGYLIVSFMFQASPFPRSKFRTLFPFYSTSAEVELEGSHLAASANSSRELLIVLRGPRATAFSIKDRTNTAVAGETRLPSLKSVRNAISCNEGNVPGGLLATGAATGPACSLICIRTHRENGLTNFGKTIAPRNSLKMSFVSRPQELPPPSNTCP